MLYLQFLEWGLKVSTTISSAFVYCMGTCGLGDRDLMYDQRNLGWSLRPRVDLVGILPGTSKDK